MPTLKKTNKSELKTAFYLNVSALVFALLILAGCTGMMVDSMVQSIITGKSYAELQPGFDHIKPEHGRLFVYRTEHSTETEIDSNIGFVKNRVHCTIDNNVYWLMWEVFFYQDLAAGQHQVTCGKKIHYDTDFWSGEGKFKPGSQQLTVTLTANKTLYLRIDIIKGKPTPKLVSTEVAAREISQLAIQHDELLIGQLDKAGSETTQ